MTTRTFTTEVVQHEGSTATGIEVPFDPKEVFGKVRAPVRVTIHGHTFRTTVFRMSGQVFFPLNKENRAAAGIEAGEQVKVTVTLDTGPRTVTPQTELAAALKRSKKLSAAWDGLSYTAQREHVEAIAGAKRPDTKKRRLTKTLEYLRSRVS